MPRCTYTSQQKSNPSRDPVPLKGPELEIFGSGVFTQIRPLRVGDLGTRPKNPKLGWFRPENR